ncbi:uncharacterized protein LOC120841255 [Ixodes scapularis]|uniref:uncharacterized protein LOC120841255 n=1 Tax=Ixodes scapularis TaxID=6945 RepID=UPI001A9E33C8|nr:uncharacterized protein LOC120841255 [Ixodes scapularis]
MATWRDGLSEIEREMFAYSESVGLSPYSHTPEKRARKVRLPNEEDMSAQPDPSPDPDAWRLVTTAWCSCKRCEVMPTSRECACCRECPPAVTAQPKGCVTEHADFSLICLQPAVLRVAFWALQEAGHNPAQGNRDNLGRNPNLMLKDTWVQACQAEYKDKEMATTAGKGTSATPESQGVNLDTTKLLRSSEATRDSV